LTPAWIQSIDFAIVANDRAPDLNFRQLFTSYRATAADIERGCDVIVWMGITVHRELTVPTRLQLPGGEIHQGSPNLRIVPGRATSRSS
jgi:hypothetical protein